jgi:hypothetical protein
MLLSSSGFKEMHRARACAPASQYGLSGCFMGCQIAQRRLTLLLLPLLLLLLRDTETLFKLGLALHTGGMQLCQC